MVLIGLKYYLKGRKMASHPTISFVLGPMPELCDQIHEFNVLETY